MTEMTDWIEYKPDTKPEKDGFYIVTMDGEICGEDHPIVSSCWYEDGKWDEAEVYAYKLPPLNDMEPFVLKHKTVAEKISDYCEYRGISQREFAEEVGMTEVAVSRLIKDGRLPSPMYLRNICSVLGETLDELLEGEE